MMKKWILYALTLLCGNSLLAQEISNQEEFEDTKDYIIAAFTKGTLEKYVQSFDNNSKKKNSWENTIKGELEKNKQDDPIAGEDLNNLLENHDFANFCKGFVKELQKLEYDKDSSYCKNIHALYNKLDENRRSAIANKYPESIDRCSFEELFSKEESTDMKNTEQELEDLKKFIIDKIQELKTEAEKKYKFLSRVVIVLGILVLALLVVGIRCLILLVRLLRLIKPQEETREEKKPSKPKTHTDGGYQKGNQGEHKTPSPNKKNDAPINNKTNRESTPQNTENKHNTNKRDYPDPKQEPLQQPEPEKELLQQLEPEKVIYAEAKELRLSEVSEKRGHYCITVDKSNPNEGEYMIKKGDTEEIINNKEAVIKGICEEEGDGNNAQSIHMISPGRVKKVEDGLWEIVEKAKIKYIN